MRSRYTVREKERAHFVTSTVVDWLPLFVLPGCEASPEHWRYSSAHEWLPGAALVLRCDDWR